MGIIISVTNQKGGVGKTVTVSSIASILTSQGYKVLVINLDPQRNLDMVAGRNVAIDRSDTETQNVLEVLQGKCGLNDVAIPSNLGMLVRASSFLSQWTGRKLLSREEFEQTPKENLVKLIEDRYKAGWGANDAEVLNQELKKVRDQYDYILMDTNPSLTLLTLNSLFAADYVLIPAFTEAASRDAILELWDTIQNIRYYNPDKNLKVLGILITKYLPRTRIARKYINTYDKMAKQMGTVLFKTKIRQSVSVSEYMTNQEDLLRYDPDGNASTDYRAFVEEMKALINELEDNK